MSDKDIKEDINDEEQTEAAETAPSSPASELVDLVLSGELHAANEKFNGIVESKVVQSIEDEKLKIAQTLFNEADEEEEEGDDDGEEKPKKDDDDDEEVDEAKKVKEDYKENPSILDDTICVEVHEDSPYLMEREERYKGLVVTSGSVDIGSFKLHDL